MAIPTSPGSKQMMLDQFIKSMRPIWPNLTKKETPMDYMNRRVVLLEQTFYRVFGVNHEQD